jgi:Domain of unknown function (DUF4384)
VFRILSFICVLLLPCATQLAILGSPQKETPRAIISDDFTKARPQAKKRRNSAGHSRKSSRAYHLASTPLDRFGLDTLQLGVTLWKLQRVVGYSTLETRRPEARFTATRVEADAPFRQGDLLRISFESPRAGYLYVIDRDWFTDGSSGETNLIFPVRGDDNRLYPGRLIDIPAEDQKPFRANPKPNQAGELLTIIVTSAPLPLPISSEPLRISNGQLLEWNRRWSNLIERFEMNDGAGQTRTIEERQAAARKGMRQLTRDDPAPQTIYRITPTSGDGLLFNLLLSYVQ